eukprot:scaffold133388_cov87-Phaeocystis_antarctica.AAC.3
MSAPSRRRFVLLPLGALLVAPRLVLPLSKLPLLPSVLWPARAHGWLAGRSKRRLPARPLHALGAKRLHCFCFSCSAVVAPAPQRFRVTACRPRLAGAVGACPPASCGPCGCRPCSRLLPVAPGGTHGQREWRIARRTANSSAVSAFLCVIPFRPVFHGPGTLIGVPRSGRVSGVPCTMIVTGVVEATSGQSLGSSSTMRRASRARRACRT